VKTTIHTKSHSAGHIVPAGTKGIILGVILKNGFPCYVVDFGLVWVLAVLGNSPLIEMEGER
jgi:hypothetical protein